MYKLWSVIFNVASILVKWTQNLKNNFFFGKYGVKQKNCHHQNDFIFKLSIWYKKCVQICPLAKKLWFWPLIALLPFFHYGKERGVPGVSFGATQYIFFNHDVIINISANFGFMTKRLIDLTLVGDSSNRPDSSRRL